VKAPRWHAWVTFQHVYAGAVLASHLLEREPVAFVEKLRKCGNLKSKQLEAGARFPRKAQTLEQDIR
jgi:hypothetical protein